MVVEGKWVNTAFCRQQFWQKLLEDKRADLVILLEEVGMVANFPELHDGVHQRAGLRAQGFARKDALQRYFIPYGFVQRFLRVAPQMQCKQ